MTATVTPLDPVAEVRRVERLDGCYTGEVVYLDGVTDAGKIGGQPPYPEYGDGWYVVVRDRFGGLVAYAHTGAEYARYFPPGTARRAD